MATQKCDCSGETPWNMCKDIGRELKAVFFPCPSTLITVYRAYYNKATFTEICKKDKWETKYELMQMGWAVHFWYLMVILIMSIIFRSIVIAEFNIPGLSPIGTADIIQVAITVLSFMWCLTVTKYPVACCLDRFTNAGLFTIVAAIVAVLDLINALEDFGRQWKKELFIVVAIVRILDLTVMVPITHWAVNTTYVLKQAFDEQKKYAPSAKVEPAKEEPKEEKK